MYDASQQATIYFELDTLGNVRRLRGGRRLDPGKPALPSDLGGYAYTAFGRMLPPDAATPAPEIDGQPFEQPLRWQGRWYTPLAGGTYDFRARQWSPALGTFLSADRFGFLTSTGTLWSWPGENALAYGDRHGRSPTALALAGAGALGGAVNAGLTWATGGTPTEVRNAFWGGATAGALDPLITPWAAGPAGVVVEDWLNGKPTSPGRLLLASATAGIGSKVLGLFTGEPPVTGPKDVFEPSRSPNEMLPSAVTGGAVAFSGLAMSPEQGCEGASGERSPEGTGGSGW